MVGRCTCVCVSVCVCVCMYLRPCANVLSIDTYFLPPPNFQPHRGVEPQSGSPCCDFIAAEDHTHFLADLVDEDEEAAGFI